jgi:hypothetical protein
MVICCMKCMSALAPYIIFLCSQLTSSRAGRLVGARMRVRFLCSMFTAVALLSTVDELMLNDI